MNRRRLERNKLDKITAKASTHFVRFSNLRQIDRVFLGVDASLLNVVLPHVAEVAPAFLCLYLSRSRRRGSPCIFMFVFISSHVAEVAPAFSCLYLYSSQRKSYNFEDRLFKSSTYFWAKQSIKYP
ncbi:hypothetical protein T492DRAFT_465005 [Pavlovales sp. CCMP2436]|nr:hypothetical protein T492DRAFT_465005 [Pavlovales sp. CCMP2436]